ncbi:MAG: Ig-like domain-containing protein [Paludibacteraceae bacterium]|nr:Ig-like domain-containing protein [Paludibacteraceae bacterium]
MMNKTTHISLFTLLALLLTFYSCANKGVGPQGGPKDETPPQMQKEVPENGTLNFSGKTIILYFNEYVQLDKVADNVMISPPQQKPPVIKAIGKRVIVAFEEPLRDSTTYTIDFGSAICDNNEKNPMQGYSYSFSTGDHIDTLEIKGQVLNARDLNPMSGITVGIHANHADSAFEREVFTRIAKTDENGLFNIQNIKSGSYRIYALNDVNKDYVYQTGELLSFTDSVFTPTMRREITADTIWKDTIDIDTVIIAEKTLPNIDNIVLYVFKEDKKRHYFIRCVREAPNYFRLFFSAPQDSMPRVMPLQTDWLKYALCQPNATFDTITYWLTDSAVIHTDTLQMEMTYLKTDSLWQLQEQTDTVKAIYRSPRLSDRAREKAEKAERERKVRLTTNANNSFDIFDTLQIVADTPLDTIKWDSIQLLIKQDTTWLKTNFTVQPADSSKMRYNLLTEWQFGQTYRLLIDSCTVKDIYGKTNEKSRNELKVKKADEYASIIVKIEPYDERAVIEVIDEKENIIRSQKAKKEGCKFENLKPKAYYLRLFIDENGDGKWTTGDWSKRTQPEPVYYFSKKLTLRANWDFEETFEYLTQPRHLQKPETIKKDGSKKK